MLYYFFLHYKTNKSFEMALLDCCLLKNGICIDLRKIILSYYQDPISNKELYQAVQNYTNSIIIMLYGPISLWNTSQITSMARLFENKIKFNEDISHWDTSNVLDMNSMFFFALSFNQDLSKWDTSRVVNMSKMFHTAKSFNSNISPWNTRQVTDMNLMFFDTYNFNQDLSSWDISNVDNMDEMFEKARNFDQTKIETWDLTNKSTEYMFYQTGINIRP